MGEPSTVHSASYAVALHEVDGVPVLSWPPAPDTVHPVFQGAAPTVRQLMARSLSAIRLVRPEPLSAATFDDPKPNGPNQADHVLTVREAVGPAPYVGRPFCYAWRVAVDGANRWVAGPADMLYL